MTHESLNPDEREVLEAEMTVFAAEIVSGQIRGAIEERKLNGAEETQEIDIRGNIDGTPYRVVIPAKGSKKGNNMESMSTYVEELHHKQEEAYLNGDQPALDVVNEELDQVVTDEILEAMKGDK